MSSCAWTLLFAAAVLGLSPEYTGNKALQAGPEPIVDPLKDEEEVAAESIIVDKGRSADNVKSLYTEEELRSMNDMLVSNPEFVGVNLIHSTDTVIHAESNGIGYMAAFDGTKSGVSKIFIAGSTPINLLTVESNEAGHRWIFKNYSSISVNGTITDANCKALADPMKSILGELVIQMNELYRMPEFHKIVWLSRALGEAQMDGKSNPLTLWLHQLAAEHTHLSSDSHSENILDKNGIKKSIEAQLAKLHPRHTMKAGEKLDNLKESKGESFETISTGEYSVKPVHSCNNACFGMCGKGCKCWSHVCGTCDTYRGCWVQDCHTSCQVSSHVHQWLYDMRTTACNSKECAQRFCTQDSVPTTC